MFSLRGADSTCVFILFSSASQVYITAARFYGPTLARGTYESRETML